MAAKFRYCRICRADLIPLADIDAMIDRGYALIELTGPRGQVELWFCDDHSPEEISAYLEQYFREHHIPFPSPRRVMDRWQIIEV